MQHSNVPEGTSTVPAEGDDVNAAIAAAATQLGVTSGHVNWTLDKGWFRNDSGAVVPRDTLRIFAWTRDPAELEAQDDTQKWLSQLIGHMGFEGAKVAVSGAGDSLSCRLEVADPGRLVGRRGVTLKAVEHLLLMSVGADHPEKSFRLDVPKGDRDDRGGDRDRGDRGGDRDRGDRGGRGGDRDRGGRGGDRDRGPRRERSDRGGERSERGGERGERRPRGPRREEDDAALARKLRRMARKIVDRVLETGEAETVRKELNSFDRRIVHLVATETKGVGSRSIGDGSYKQIEIYPMSGGPSESAGEE